MVHFILENTDFLVSNYAFIGAAIGAIGNVVGGLLGNKAQKDTNKQNAEQNQMMMRFNQEEAQKNREWQERMSNTEIARRVADLRASGFNPAMINNVPSGASSPSGSSASVGGLTPMQAPTSFAESVGQASLTASQIELNKAQAENLNANAHKTEIETDWMPKLNQSQIDINESYIKVNGKDVELKDEQKQQIAELIVKTKQETSNLKKQIEQISASIENMNADTAIKKIDSAFEEKRLKAQIADISAHARLSVAQTTEIYKLMLFKALNLKADSALKNEQATHQSIVNADGVLSLNLRQDNYDIESELEPYKQVVNGLGTVAGTVVGSFGAGDMLIKDIKHKTEDTKKGIYKNAKTKAKNSNSFLKMYGRD